MRVWAGGGLAQQSSSERLVDSCANGSKDDLSLQGHYGLPVSCERFCRSVTAGRLPACVFCFRLIWPGYLGALCRRRASCLAALGLASACESAVSASREDTRGLHPWVAGILSSSAIRDNLDCLGWIQLLSMGTEPMTRLCCYWVGLGRPSCAVHEGRRGVSGCSRIFLHNLIQQPNLGEPSLHL